MDAIVGSKKLARCAAWQIWFVLSAIRWIFIKSMGKTGEKDHALDAVIYCNRTYVCRPVKQGLKNTSKTSMIVFVLRVIFLQYVEYNGQDIDQQKRTG